MTDQKPNTCPQCQRDENVPMSDGVRLCLNCRHEWNPADVPAAAPVLDDGATTNGGGDGDTTRAAVEAAPSILDDIDAPAFALVPPPDDDDDVPPPDALDDVLGPPAAVVAADEASAVLDALVGTEVVLDGGQRAWIVEFPDDDHVTVDLRITGDADAGDIVTVDFNTVERGAAVPVVDVPDATARALAGANLAVAALALRAGLATLAGEYPNAELVTPPTGWLPNDPEVLPTIEQGVAYGIALLVHAFSIDRDILGAIIDTLLVDAEETQPTKGGNE